MRRFTIEYGAGWPYPHATCPCSWGTTKCHRGGADHGCEEGDLSHQEGCDNQEGCAGQDRRIGEQGHGRAGDQGKRGSARCRQSCCEAGRHGRGS